MNHIEKRDMYNLLPAGRERHEALLGTYAVESVRSGLAPQYERFLDLNDEFKQLCTDWQMRGDAPNEHVDSGLRPRLRGHASWRSTIASQDVIEAMAACVPRIERYNARLDRAAGVCRDWRHQTIHRCDVRVVPRHLDGAARGPDRDARHRTSRGRQLLTLASRSSGKERVHGRFVTEQVVERHDLAVTNHHALQPILIDGDAIAIGDHVEATEHHIVSAGGQLDRVRLEGPTADLEHGLRNLTDRLPSAARPRDLRVTGVRPHAVFVPKGQEPVQIGGHPVIPGLLCDAERRRISHVQPPRQHDTLCLHDYRYASASSSGYGRTRPSGDT